MMVSSKKQWGMWLFYLPLAVILLVVLLQNVTIPSLFTPDYLVLLFLALIIGINPTRHNYTYYSFLGGLSLVTYVVAGLLPEILLSSLAMIVLIIRSDLKMDQHHLYPLYLSIITGVSILAAGGYEGTRFLIGNSVFPGHQVLPLVVYMLVQSLTNQTLSTFSAKYFLEETKTQFFDEYFRFILLLAGIMLPFAYAMLYMYLARGTIGLFLLSIPYLIVAIGTKHYYRVYNHRHILLKVNRYSRSLSKKTEMNHVIRSFVQYLPKLFPAGQIAFGQRDETGDIVLEQIYETGKDLRKPRGRVLIEKHSPVTEAMRTQEMAVYLKAEDWQTEPLYEGDYHPQSVVVLPITIFSDEIGVLLMTHPHQGVYDDFFVSLIEVFYMYVQIILNNAYNFERLAKSNFTDFLTGLPNYRGFATYFDQVIEVGEYDSLSLIILDLDHFKKVNDIHGHEAGNEVLKDMAKLLNDWEEANEMVARYGGEEFVILLKDAGRKKALEKAEEIRTLIEDHTCQVTQSIQADGMAAVQVTASIGVATYPDNCSNVYDLVRLADDTMYTKSKRGGRNRVSEFEGYATDSVF